MARVQANHPAQELLVDLAEDFDWDDAEGIGAIGIVEARDNAAQRQPVPVVGADDFASKRTQAVEPHERAHGEVGARGGFDGDAFRLRQKHDLRRGCEQRQNRDILRALGGDFVLRSRNVNTPMAIQERVRHALSATRFSLSAPTQNLPLA